MKLKVLKERIQNTVVENDLRGLGHFVEPMPKFELILPLPEMANEGVERLAQIWGMNGLLEEGCIRFSKDAAPHIQAIYGFFFAADLLRGNHAKSLRIELVQGVRELLHPRAEPSKKNFDDAGLLLHPAVLYHFHQAGFWRDDFSIDEIESLMQKRSLLFFTNQNVQVLMENLGFDYGQAEGGLNYAK